MTWRLKVIWDEETVIDSFWLMAVRLPVCVWYWQRLYLLLNVTIIGRLLFHTHNQPFAFIRIPEIQFLGHLLLQRVRGVCLVLCRHGAILSERHRPSYLEHLQQLVEYRSLSTIEREFHLWSWTSQKQSWVSCRRVLAQFRRRRSVLRNSSTSWIRSAIFDNFQWLKRARRAFFIGSIARIMNCDICSEMKRFM